MEITNNIGKDLKVIQVDDYWVVVDLKAKIEIDDLVYYLHNSNLQKPSIKIVVNPNYSNYKPYSIRFTGGFGVAEDCIKIIASSKVIDKSIPVIVFEEISKEELIMKLYPKGNYEPALAKKYFKEGLEKAGASDKKYTEEDLEIMYNAGQEDCGEFGSVRGFEQMKSEKLNQSKLPETIDLEFEEIIKGQCDCSCHEPRNRIVHSSPCCYPEIEYKLKTTSTEDGEVIIIKI